MSDHDSEWTMDSEVDEYLIGFIAGLVVARLEAAAVNEEEPGVETANERAASLTFSHRLHCRSRLPDPTPTNFHVTYAPESSSPLHPRTILFLSLHPLRH